jgi:hypothetical protein
MMTNANQDGMLTYSDLMALAESAGLGPSNVSASLQARLEIFGRAVEKAVQKLERQRCKQDALDIIDDRRDAGRQIGFNAIHDVLDRISSRDE